MLISERLDTLYFLLESFSLNQSYLSPVTRRMMAYAIIAEMQQAKALLEELNAKLDTELSVEEANIDFDKWGGSNDSWKDIQKLLAKEVYLIDHPYSPVINYMIDFFPLNDKNSSFSSEKADNLKTCLRQLNSESVVHHSDISFAISSGIGSIVTLLFQIKRKMTNIKDELYEDYCDKVLCEAMDFYHQRAEDDYNKWKEEHDENDIQVLEDKRSQEILNLLNSGIFTHSTQPSNREIQNCPIKIDEAALEHDTQLPENIYVELARFSKMVDINGGIFSFNELKLGKYLYIHHLELSDQELATLKQFDCMLYIIQAQMAECNPTLKQYLPGYEDDILREYLDRGIHIMEVCNQFLNEKVPQDILVSYLSGAFYGDIKQDVQRKLSKKSPYKILCKMLGMLKASTRVFKIDTISSDIASALSQVIDSLETKSLQRYIDEGSSELKSPLRKWTDKFIFDNLYTEEEKKFARLSAL